MQMATVSRDILALGVMYVYVLVGGRRHVVVPDITKHFEVCIMHQVPRAVLLAEHDFAAQGTETFTVHCPTEFELSNGDVVLRDNQRQ